MARNALTVALLLGLAMMSIPVLAQSDPKADARTVSETGTKANRLLRAASPYLRLHAYNPVDWHEWGSEAFEKARREGKPIFLSVGYATCYWCHVMARESFENEDIAKHLNATTIPVKVDRERRPDVDATYMLATELISQQGGWPNSVFLTPELKPFYGFGYVRPDEFKQVVERVDAGWKEQRPVIMADASRIADVIAKAMNRRADKVEITPAIMRRASMHMLARLDVFNGGLGTAPKFPQENVIQFLLHRAERDNDKISLDAALLTLDNIIRGGIHDHVAGGFHRYATDNAWAIPHFEKMLYNQALMTRALLKAYELTGNERYSDAARQTLDFVIDGMTLPSGGIASAFDAETDGKEGLFYLWTQEEFQAVLGPDMSFGAAIFGVTAEGNHEGSNTLRLVEPRADLAKAQKMTVEAFDERLATVVKKLAEARGKRKPLKRDDKVLTSWNAMMVRALADASRVLAEPRYLKAAVRAQNFLFEKLGGRTGDLKRSYFEGKSSLDGTQSDYAFVALASVALFDATDDAQWLSNAEMLAGKMVQLFEDKDAGGLFLTATETGFTKSKDTDDSTVPSGNAVALELFVRLRQRTDNVVWRRRVLSQMAVLTGIASSEPVAHAATLLAADMAVLGETGAHQAAAYGAVRLSVARTDRDRARIRVRLAPGWHINSIAPKQDFLIPTKINVDGVEPENVSFPKAIDRKLAFHDEALSLYEGQVEIGVKLPAGEAGLAARRVKIDIQACSDRICLDPQVIHALLPAASHRGATKP